MHNKEQIAWNNLKLLRKSFDKLLKQFGGQIPETKIKAIQFSENLYALVDKHTSAGGFISPRKLYPEPLKKVIEDDPKDPKKEEGGDPESLDTTDVVDKNDEVDKQETNTSHIFKREDLETTEQ